MTPTTTAPVSTLVLDYLLYPRHHVDSHNVTSIVAAMEAGETLPPIVVDAATMRVVDGFHRTLAAQRCDPEGTVAVDARTYDSDAALFRDAVALNARHGVRLTRWDQARCLTLARRYELDDEDIASALAIPVDRARELRRARTAYDPGGQAVELKRSTVRLAGRRLTAQQVAANERASGWPPVFHARQLVDALDAGFVELADAAVRAALRELRARLDAMDLDTDSDSDNREAV